MPIMFSVFYWYAKPRVPGSIFRLPIQIKIYRKCTFLKNAWGGTHEVTIGLMPIELKLLTSI